MRRGQEHGTRQALREMQWYGQANLSLLGCKMTRTSPSFRVYDGPEGPIKIYDEPVVQSFSLRLQNHGDAPLQLHAVETHVHDCWCMRPEYNYRLLCWDCGDFDILLGTTGDEVHPLRCTIPAHSTMDWRLSVASRVAHAKGTALVAMSLCVYYGGGQVSLDSEPMVLSVDNRFRDIDTEPGQEEDMEPDPEPEEAQRLPANLRNWKALRKFLRYPGLMNLEFLELYRDYAREAALEKWPVY